MAKPEIKKILMVEDDPDIQTVAEMSLQDVGGFSVRLCSSGLEALSVVGEFMPDLILLDVMMPEMDGPTTLSELRNRDQFKAIPVIFMTAKVQPQEVEAYLLLGAIGVIHKPFDPMLLPGEIREIWQHHNG
jgi:two-component system, OmpR family, response regulator